MRKAFEFDPFEGNHVDAYIFTLDDGSEWVFRWHAYESNKLNIQEGDRLQVIETGNDEFSMIIPLEKPVILNFHSYGPPKTFISK